MGGVKSKSRVPECDFALITQGLGLRPDDVKRLFAFFSGAAKGAGTLPRRAFLSALDLERSKFARKAMNLFDVDASGDLDFEEFAVCIWNYCTLSRAGLGDFVFQLYDDNCNGAISLDEVQLAVQDLFGSVDAPAAAKVMSAVHAVWFNDHVRINVPQFNKFLSTHQNLLRPAFELQARLQGKIGGRDFWSKQTLARAAMARSEDGDPYARCREALRLRRGEVVPAAARSSPAPGPSPSPVAQRSSRRVAVDAAGAGAEPTMPSPASSTGSPGDSSAAGFTAERRERRERRRARASEVSPRASAAGKRAARVSVGPGSRPPRISVNSPSQRRLTRFSETGTEATTRSPRWSSGASSPVGVSDALDSEVDMLRRGALQKRASARAQHVGGSSRAVRYSASSAPPVDLDDQARKVFREQRQRERQAAIERALSRKVPSARRLV